MLFENDTMVIPKESEWFAFYTPGQDKEILPFEKSALYLTVSKEKNLKSRISINHKSAQSDFL